MFFQDPALARLLSSESLLARRYGRSLAEQIKLRLLVLKAAAHLAMVPNKPPFSLRRAGAGEFVIDVGPDMLLRLCPDDGPPRAKLAAIKSVLILDLTQS